MGRKIFVSYKYADDQVANLDYNVNTTVRDYVTAFENYLDESDHIYKGESDGEDLSQLSDDTIWEKLKDRIYDSSITIVFISPKMKESNVKDRDQWIPWEISYSLKETSRKNSNGDSVTSRTNAMLAVVLPDKNGDYSYYLENKHCCASGCVSHHLGRLFFILRKNKFNYCNGSTSECEEREKVWSGPCSYIEAVRWDKFIKDVNYYIDKSVKWQENLEDYDITKEVE